MAKKTSLFIILLLSWGTFCFAKMHIHTDASDYRAGEHKNANKMNFFVNLICICAEKVVPLQAIFYNKRFVCIADVLAKYGRFIHVR